MTPEHAASNRILSLYYNALERIANCDEGNCERYVAAVDAIAVEALVQGKSILMEYVDQSIVENDIVAGTLPRAA
jgi:hypothetical protein